MNGGGNFTTQNKKIPGAYINFVSAKKAAANAAERGTVAMAMELDWGASGLLEITNETLTTKSLVTFGYEFGAAALRYIREVLLHATKLRLYRLNGSGTKAANAFGEAKYAGPRGNSIITVIAKNADDNSKYDVSTYLGTQLIEKQNAVASGAELVDNDFFVFDKTCTLTVTSGTACTGGTNSTVTGTDHSAFLALLEEQSYNVLCTASTDSSVKALYAAFTRRMIEECGVKIQTVLYSSASDYEYIINEATAADLVPWTAGARAGCAINSSITNMKYDGEYDINVSYTQSQLTDAIDAGQLVFHKVGDGHCVLRDINSLVTTTETKSEDFKSNQVISILCQIGNDVAALFDKTYMGKVPNDDVGRVDFWGSLVTYFKTLLKLRAIENFDQNNDLTVRKGEKKNAVEVDTAITPVSCMETLYMTVKVA